MRLSFIIPVALIMISQHFYVNNVKAQSYSSTEADDEEIYYVGLNILAPFTMIRSSFTTGYLPAATNLESGFAVFIGKIWNKNYNVETRLSYGSPKIDYSQFVVQSGGMYCFNSRRKATNFYSGLFLKFEALTDQANETDYLSTICYLTIGNRFKINRFFIDLRLNENLIGISWANLPGHETKVGFHEPIYSWKSAYVPFGVINIGYFF